MTLPRFKEIRKKLGLTQGEFANYLNEDKGLKISRSSIAQYESGANLPPESTLKKLSKALDVTETYLSGKGTQAYEIDEKLISYLHDSFFTPNYGGNKAHQYIVNYLELKNNKNTPFSFYRDSNGDILEFLNGERFPRFKNIDDFWKDKFLFLFEDKDFRNSLIGTTDQEFNELTTQRIKKQYYQDIKNRNWRVLIETNDEIHKNITDKTIQVINKKATQKELKQTIEKAKDQLNWALNSFFNTDKKG